MGKGAQFKIFDFFFGLKNCNVLKLVDLYNYLAMQLCALTKYPLLKMGWILLSSTSFSCHDGSGKKALLSIFKIVACIKGKEEHLPGGNAVAAAKF
jgi:hypothetical protein